MPPLACWGSGGMAQPLGELFGPGGAPGGSILVHVSLDRCPLSPPEATGTVVCPGLALMVLCPPYLIRLTSGPLKGGRALEGRRCSLRVCPCFSAASSSPSPPGGRERESAQLTGGTGASLLGGGPLGGVGLLLLWPLPLRWEKAARQESNNEAPT